jgi:NTP pyrophosphatase (non-canonical NTP hydrolase)
LWKSPEELDARISEKRKEIEDEIADIGIYLTELADNLGIDLLAVMERKIEKNALKYPAQRVKGSSKKYNEYSDESLSKVDET